MNNTGACGVQMNQVTVFETFYYKHDMHNTTQSWYTTKKWEAIIRTCKSSIILPISTKPIQQTQQKITQTIFEHLIYQISTKTQTSRNQRLLTWNMLRKIENPYLFLKFKVEKMKKNGGFFRETRWVCKRDEQTRQWIVKMNEGKLKCF